MELRAAVHGEYQHNRLARLSITCNISPVNTLTAALGTVQHHIGMSEKREYAISTYLALCRIFAYFSKVRISHIFSACFCIFGGNKYSL